LKYQTPGKRSLTYNWRWLENAFPKGQRRFLTITSDKNNTTVYLYKIVQKKEGTVEFRIQLILNNEETRKKCVSGLNSAYKNHFSPVNTSFVDKSSFKRNRKFRVLEKEV
jgi:hypothetical protein